MFLGDILVTFLMIILSRCQNEKVCLDCACVYGLHVGPSRCTSISMFFAWFHDLFVFFSDFVASRFLRDFKGGRAVPGRPVDAFPGEKIVSFGAFVDMFL